MAEDVVGCAILSEDVEVINFKLCRREGDQYVGKTICSYCPRGGGEEEERFYEFDVLLNGLTSILFRITA